MSKLPDEQFVAEYPCDRFCRIEVDLDDTHAGFTLRQMREVAGVEHQRVHPRDPVTARRSPLNSRRIA